MSEQTNFVQGGVERVREAFENLDDEFQKVQKQIQTRRRALERRLESQRKDLEKRTRRIQKELRKNPVLKRAEALADDAGRQVEQGVDRILAAFQIASKSDLERIDRKLGRINRKLREIEKASKPNGSGNTTSA